MSSNNIIDEVISPLIPYEFPQFYQSDGPMFIEFVQAYYQWLEQSANSQYVGSITTESRNLPSYWDIDTTSSKFLKYFEDTFLVNIPKNLSIDTRFLVKHALEFYNSKGTIDSFELLFRMLYNQSIEVNTPGQYMFRLSNGNWTIPKYIEVNDSPYLGQLDGKLIISSSGSTAVVESYSKKIINGKVVNILYLSSLTKDFNFNEFIYCDSFPEMTGINAPLVLGSLSTITVENGGINFNVGDLLEISGSGTGGVARVVATRNENGKVSFSLINGGFGFSANAVITIDNTGTGGSGASFQIGGLTNQQTISLNTDVIDGLYNTVIDLSTSGFKVDITNASSSFLNDEIVYGNALSLHLNIKELHTLTSLSNGETISNSSLGITPLTVYFADGQDIYLTGNNSALTNANLVNGTLLICDDNNTLIEILCVDPVQTVFANCFVIGSGSNTSVLSVNRMDTNPIGYYVPGMVITGNISGTTATVTSCTRLTDWSYFPVVGFNNLNDIIQESFSTVTEVIGTISFLKNENPGSGYASSPSISIIEPLIYSLKIDDGIGGFWGFDASITASASNTGGIVTALSVLDSGFGWSPDEFLIMSEANNNSAVFGKAIVRTTGTGVGYWNNTQSFLDDVMVLQDDYYYQVYSYEIISEMMLNIYESVIKNLAHPVGYMLFGKYNVRRELPSPVSLISSSIVQDSAIIFYTSDSILLTSDNYVITVDQYTTTNSFIESLDLQEIDTTDGDILAYDMYTYLLTDDEQLLVSNGDYLVIGS
jgi:hypothetical protein